MTRALPSQPSPKFLTSEMFSAEVQPDYSPTCPPHVLQTPSQFTRSKTSTIVKPKRRSRPSYSKMIEEAVFKNSERRKGASLISIKKHLHEKFGVDVKKTAKRICKCIRESVSNGGNLRQVTGHGANGSFALTINGRKIFKDEKIQSGKIKIVPTVAGKIKKRRNSTANSRQTDTPVTRMRVK